MKKSFLGSNQAANNQAAQQIELGPDPNRNPAGLEDLHCNLNLYIVE